MKIWINSLLILACFVATERLTHHVTQGFSLRRIQTTQENAAQVQAPPEEIFNLASRTFHYLGSGSQSFAFVSDDKKYVLKFFKFKGSIYNLHKSKKRRHSFSRALRSCLIYEKALKNDAALIYCHLQPSTLDLPEITLIDPSWHHHQLLLNAYPFILQRYVEPVKDRLIRLAKDGKHEEIKTSLEALCDLLLKRYRLGYSDKDPHLIHNFGFLDDQPIFLDVGGLIDDRPHLEDYFFNHELDSAARKSTQWLSRYYPEAVDVIEKKILDIKSFAD